MNGRKPTKHNLLHIVFFLIMLPAYSAFTTRYPSLNSCESNLEFIRQKKREFILINFLKVIETEHL
jgi:hypothetical protein